MHYVDQRDLAGAYDWLERMLRSHQVAFRLIALENHTAVLQLGPRVGLLSSLQSRVEYDHLVASNTSTDDLASQGYFCQARGFLGARVLEFVNIWTGIVQIKYKEQGGHVTKMWVGEREKLL